eukprot:TRINITY_DN1063_c0_g1_i1.p1 TRINITY_DN1063_c0_g1~~TRINITY_DN1063_c0_g1_i1.p1  ORF type:complete len:103 (+),score=9.61 TRINITY_DN1063_c0_g1_i1:34-342(+)
MDESYKSSLAGGTKVVVFFKNAGSAPVLSRKKFRVLLSIRIGSLLGKLRVFLGKSIKPEDSLYLYVNGVFQPKPDDTVGDLFKQFHSGEELILNYSLVPAWG